MEDFVMVDLSDESSFSFEDIEDDLCGVRPRSPLQPGEEKVDKVVEDQDGKVNGFGDGLLSSLHPADDAVKAASDVEDVVSGGETPFLSPSDKEFKGTDPVLVSSDGDDNQNDAKGISAAFSGEQESDDGVCSDDCVWCQGQKGASDEDFDFDSEDYDNEEEDIDSEGFDNEEEDTAEVEVEELAQMLEPTGPVAESTSDKIDDGEERRLVKNTEVDTDEDEDDFSEEDYTEDDDGDEDDCSEEDYTEDDDGGEDDCSEEDYTEDDDGDEDDCSEEDYTEDDDGDEDDYCEEHAEDEDGDEDGYWEEDYTEDDDGDEDDYCEEEDLDSDSRLDVGEDKNTNEDCIVKAEEPLLVAKERKENEGHEVVKGDEEAAHEGKEAQSDSAAVDATSDAWFNCESGSEDEYEDALDDQHAQEDSKSVEDKSVNVEEDKKNEIKQEESLEEGKKNEIKQEESLGDQEDEQSRKDGDDKGYRDGAERSRREFGGIHYQVSLPFYGRHIEEQRFGVYDEVWGFKSYLRFGKVYERAILVTLLGFSYAVSLSFS